jgi:molecular chaperone DnaJ
VVPFNKCKMKNPYEILGVSPDTPLEDVKKAYKKLAMEWHPDRHGGDKNAEEKFKEINNAYQIITKKNNNNGMHVDDIDIESLFSQFGFGSHFSNVHQDTALSMQVSLEDVYSGCTKSVNFSIKEKCSSCNGSGKKLSNETCPGCKGSGKLRAPGSSGMFVFMVTCQLCGGIGRKNDGSCEVCHGVGSIQKHHDTKIVIPKGAWHGDVLIADDGSKIRIHFMNHDFLSIIPGSLNIGSEISVNIFDFIVGGEVSVKTLAGVMKVKIDAGIRPGSNLRIKEAGMINRHGQKGDHIVKIWADVPKLTKENIDILLECRKQIEKKENEK